MAFLLSPPIFKTCRTAPPLCRRPLKTSTFIPLVLPPIRPTNLQPHSSKPLTKFVAFLPGSPTNRSLLTIFSSIVGVCVLIGSLLYKIPQVFRIVRRKSAAGISVLMYAMETLGTTFSAVYFARRAFPFVTYGESIFVMVQNVLIMMLIVIYQRLPKLSALCCSAFYLIALLFLYSSFFPLKFLMALQVCSIPVLNFARVPQIFLNFRRKSTGELSPITLGLQLLGNVARVFTTIAQVKDPLMLLGICVATCFNSVLFGQWIFYSRRRPHIPKRFPIS